MPAQPGVERLSDGASSVRMVEVSWMKRDAGESGSALNQITNPSNPHRAPGSEPRTRAPPNHRRAQPTRHRQKPNRAVVLAEGKPSGGSRFVSGFACQPGGRDKTSGRESKSAQQFETACQSLARSSDIESQELAFTIGFAPCRPLIRQPTG